MTISQRIFSLLESKHLSQKDLAEYAGLSPAAISGWKSKNTSPSSDKLVKISEFLGVSVYYLLTGKEETSPFPVSELVMDSAPVFQSEPDETETELLRMFRQLPDFEKGRFLGMLEQTILDLNTMD